MVSDMQNASREERIDYLLSREKGSYTFDDLVLIMELLRSPGGCPWDIEQNHHSIRNDLWRRSTGMTRCICGRSWVTYCCRWCSMRA